MSGEGGIEHILLPEEALVLPGDVIIGADSHSCTYGALGCFSTGRRLDRPCRGAGRPARSGCRFPRRCSIVYTGTPGPWIVGKDLILSVIARIGDDGARYMAMEHTGETIEHLSMDSRLTLTNMAIEAGAKSGMIPPDATTFDYVARATSGDGPRPSSSSRSTPTIRTPSMQRSSRSMSIGDRADGGAAVAAVALGPGDVGAQRQGRPGVHRLVYERADRGPADRGARSRPTRTSRRTSGLTVIPATQRVWQTGEQRGSARPLRRSRRGRYRRRPAVHVSGRTWASSARTRSAFRPRTATTSAGWATRRRRSTSPTPPSRWPLAVAGEIVHPAAVRIEPTREALVG